MHLIVVDAQRFIKMPLSSFIVVVVVVVYIYIYIFFRCYGYPFFLFFLVSMYLSGILKFNLFNQCLFLNNIVRLVFNLIR